MRDQLITQDEFKKRNIASLNYMRGILTIVVMLAHVNLIVDADLFHGAFIQGWCGVDFFFILSGFLLVYNYKPEETETNRKAHMVSFLKKRFVRIYPTLWIYTSIVLLADLAIRSVTGNGFVTWINLNSSGILRTLFCFPTHYQINEMPAIPPARTLPFEIFFYLVSLALIGGYKAYRRILTVWILAIVAVIFFPIQNFYLAFFFNTLFIEFMLGAVAAWIVTGGKHFSKIPAFLFLVIGFIWLAVSWIGTNLGIEAIKNTNRVIAFGIPFFLILNGMVHIELNKESASGKEHKLLSFAGKSSYSLYLIHYMMLGSKGTPILGNLMVSLYLENFT